MAESAPLLRVYRLKTYRGFESLSLRQFIVCLVLTGLFSLAGCGRNETQQIDWQLPLTAPADPHGGDINQFLPEWAAAMTGSAELKLLQKDTARTFTLRLKSGGDADFESMHFRLLGLADGLRLKSGTYIRDENVHNPAAFVEISRDDSQIYRGWLYQEFPELFGPDMVDWKIWLDGVTIEPLAEDAVSQDQVETAGTTGKKATGTRP